MKTKFFQELSEIRSNHKPFPSHCKGLGVTIQGHFKERQLERMEKYRKYFPHLLSFLPSLGLFLDCWFWFIL